jgi:hypothetical protein
LIVPKTLHHSPTTGQFEMILWQPNPTSSDGQLVPTTWDAASQTGFNPGATPASAQLSFQNKPGSSTAQMDGDTVGAYLNSADLPGSPVNEKMMITPQFIWNTGSQPVPFSSSSAVLSGAMDLQIPTAVGDSTYIASDFLFAGPGGVHISYAVKIFSNGHTTPVLGGVYNLDSNCYQLNSPLGVDQRFVTQAPGSGSATGTPWLGWRHFQYTISETQFVAALNYLAAENPGVIQSTDPTKYSLLAVHLNAEFHFQPAPAELGWSMRNWQVSVTTD